MKSKSLLVLACLFSTPIFAQTLPDEINYSPYETTYRALERETAVAQSKLSQSEAGLAEAQRFIREMSERISDLEGAIFSAQSEIARLRRDIPQLEASIQQLRSEDSQVMSQLRGRQSEESNYVGRMQQAQSELRPLEAQLARREQRLRELQSELANFERQEREAVSRLNREIAEAQSLDRQIDQERSQQRQLQTELRSIETRISGVQAELSRTEGSISALNSSLSTEQSKLSALNGRVSQAESELASARASGVAEEITAAERKLRAVTQSRDSSVSDIRSLESQIGRAEGQIRTLRSQVEGLRRDQQILPSRISTSESRERQLSSQRSQTQSDINRYQAEAQTANRNTQLRASSVEGLRQEVRSDDLLVQRQRQLLENLGRQLDATRAEISSLTLRSRNLNQEIAQTSETIRSHQAAIPRLEQDIRSDRSEIAEGEAELVRARTDERTFIAAVARDQQKLTEVTRRRDGAKNELDVRQSLYNRYLSEAMSLGSAQAAAGTTLGAKEGEKISLRLSKQNGLAAGRELGTAEAKHWGSVRGEIQGFDLGYAEGLASTEDRARAVAESSSKAASDAELFAQKNFKPVFFEELVQAEFKKPLFVPGMSLKSFKSSKSLQAFTESFEAVSAPSPAELARSEELKTPLDQSILQFARDVRSIEAKVQRLSDPAVTFEPPTTIPFGTASCAQVYKGLSVFKTACDTSYKGAFAANFTASAKQSFSALYTSQFTTVFNQANVTEREAKYSAELSSASAIGNAEGLRIGKIEIYETTYASNYKTAYAAELEKARAKAKLDAGIELAEFLKVKPLLTLSSSELTAENFRADEEVSLFGKVKNVSSVALKGPVLFRITEVVNAEKILGEAVLNEAQALGVTSLPALKVKVLGSAKAGEKVIVRGVVDLPGDLYKPARQEKFELSQTLTANPAHELGLSFNRNPDIKGVFRRNIHFLTVSLKPKFEDIQAGYRLTLTPVGDAASLMEMREGAIETGAIAGGASKEFSFSYLFKDLAKRKTLSLELAVSYAGKVIRKETITLVPK